MSKPNKGLGRRSFIGTSVGVTAAALAIRPTETRAADVAKPGKTPNTLFAVNVEMWFGNKPFLQKISTAAEMGFPAIEFWP